jgi:hypothetical protein
MVVMVDYMRRQFIALFFREGGYFYPVEFMDPALCGCTMEQQAMEQAELNPGTLRVEDINGNILWRPQ